MNPPLPLWRRGSLKALEALQMNVESKQNDALTGAINGKLADGKSFTVK